MPDLVVIGSVEAASGSTGSSSMEVSFSGITKSDFQEIWVQAHLKMNTGHAGSEGSGSNLLVYVSDSSVSLNGYASQMGGSTNQNYSLTGSTYFQPPTRMTPGDTTTDANNFNQIFEMIIRNPGEVQVGTSDYAQCTMEIVSGGPQKVVAWGGSSYGNSMTWGALRADQVDYVKLDIDGSNENFGSPSRMDVYGWKY